jgi:hypothetical protein
VLSSSSASVLKPESFEGVQISAYRTLLIEAFRAEHNALAVTFRKGLQVYVLRSE